MPRVVPHGVAEGGGNLPNLRRVLVMDEEVQAGYGAAGGIGIDSGDEGSALSQDDRDVVGFQAGEEPGDLFLGV